MTTRRRMRPEVRLVLRNGPTVDVSDVVLAMSVTKPADGPTGQFRIDLLAADAQERQGRASSVTRPPLWWQQIETNDVVTLGFDTVGGIGFGFVSTVDLTTRYHGEAVERRVSLSGMMEAKPFTQDEVVKAALTAPELSEWYAALRATFGDEQHPLLVPLEGAWGPRTVDGEGQINNIMWGADIGTFVRWVLDNTTSLRVPQLTAAFGAEAADVYVVEGLTPWNNRRIWSFAPQTYQGNTWGFLRGSIDDPFYEIRADSRPIPGSDVPQPVLVVRPRPYDDPLLTWAPIDEDESTGLTRDSAPAFVPNAPGAWRIDLKAVRQASLSRSDAEATSFYVVTSDHYVGGSADALAQGLFFPLVDLYAAQRYGLRPRRAAVSLVEANVVDKQQGGAGETTTDSVSAGAAFDALADVVKTVGEAAPSGSLGREIRNFRNRLFNWHRMEPEFLRGTIIVAGADEYRPGDYIECPWVEPHIGQASSSDPVRFYVHAITWDWSMGGEYTCNMQLIRGYNSSMVTAFRNQITLAAAGVQAAEDSRSPTAEFFSTASEGSALGFEGAANIRRAQRLLVKATVTSDFWIAV